MAIIVFLIDTSASMNQRTHYGAKPTLLDVTKETVDKFIRIRQRDVASRGDRYMLLTFDEVPFNVKSGWKENHAVFINELKNLSANGLTTFGTALKNTFDYLNINRMQNGLDTYGQGRCPYVLETAFIIVITDGCKYSSSVNVQNELNLPMNTHCPGSEFTVEPFRWDQRLFSIVLRLSGTYNYDPPSNGNGFAVPCDDSPISLMCEVTGGRSFCVTSQKALSASLEQLAIRMQPGVMVKFEKFGSDPPAISLGDDDDSLSNGHLDRSWTNTRNLIYVRSNIKGYTLGHWPIPESYWPDPSNPALQPRTAHPIVKFTCINSEPTVIDNLPFDKYELDPSPLTQYILSRKQPNVAWQVYICNSQRSSELGQPFGYLKASTNLTCVNFFILPYNYPILLPLLDELIRVHQNKPTREWRQHFENYLKTMPPYYSRPLKQAMQRMSANSSLVPETYDSYLITLSNILKKYKSLAKIEYEKLTSLTNSQKSISIDYHRLSIPFNRKALMELYCTNPFLRKKFATMPHDHKEFNGFVVRYKDRLNSQSKQNSYRNLFEIPREEMLEQSSKLRKMFFQKQPLARYQNDDQIHNLPVSQMGNYQEYLKKLPTPLREIEAQPTRMHMFGNPFKLDKKNVMMIDETDFDAFPGGSGSNSSRGMKRPSDFIGGSKMKRKPGPLPKDFSYRVKSPTSMLTPPVSPLPSNGSSYSNSQFPHFTTASSTMTTINHKTTGPASSLTNHKTNKTSLPVNNNSNYSGKYNTTVDIETNGNRGKVTTNNVNLKNHLPPTQQLMVMGNNSKRSNSLPLTNGAVASAKKKNSDITDVLADYQYRRFTLSQEKKDNVRTVMRLVHSVDEKDQTELVRYLSSFKGPYGDFLLHEALYDAHRFKKRSIITLLIRNFGPKVEKFAQVLDNLQNKDSQKTKSD